MAKPSTLIAPQLRVPIVTGQDAIWQLIRQLDKKGPWAIADIDLATQVAVITTIEDYVRRLRVGGYIAVVGERAHGNNHNTPAKLYRIKINTAEAPRLRRDGSCAPPSAQAQMWRAMRRLAQFSHAELAYVASTDELTIKPITAKSYVQRLADVGVLQLVQQAKCSGGLALWRLKPSMDSGPLAPRILRTRIVFDPNRRQVIGQPSLAEDEETI